MTCNVESQVLMVSTLCTVISCRQKHSIFVNPYSRCLKCTHPVPQKQKLLLAPLYQPLNKRGVNSSTNVLMTDRRDSCHDSTYCPCHRAAQLCSPVLMGTLHFWPPTELTSLNLSLKNLSEVIMSMTSTAVQNLVEIHSGQIGEIWTKFFYLYPFLSNSRTGQTAHNIFTLDGSNVRTHTRVCFFFALVDITAHLGDQIAQKPQFGGVNRHFPAKHSKYWNVRIIKTTASIITKFYIVIETSKYSWQWSKYALNKSKTADSRYLENKKKRNISALEQPILTIFSTMMRLGPPDTICQ